MKTLLNPYIFKLIFRLLIVFWAMTTYAQEPRLMLPIGHTREVNTIDFCSNNKYFATGSEDGSVILWDFRTNKALARLELFPDAISPISKVQFSKDGNHLMAVLQSGNAMVWNVNSHNQIFRIQEPIYMESEKEKHFWQHDDIIDQTPLTDGYPYSDDSHYIIGYKDYKSSSYLEKTQKLKVWGIENKTLLFNSQDYVDYSNFELMNNQKKVLMYNREKVIMKLVDVEAGTEIDLIDTLSIKYISNIQVGNEFILLNTSSNIYLFKGSELVYKVSSADKIIATLSPNEATLYLQKRLPRNGYHHIREELVDLKSFKTLSRIDMRGGYGNVRDVFEYGYLDLYNESGNTVLLPSLFKAEGDTIFTKKGQIIFDHNEFENGNGYDSFISELGKYYINQNSDSVFVWGINDKKQYLKFYRSFGGNTRVFNNDELLIATGDSLTRIWDLDTKKLLLEEKSTDYYYAKDKYLYVVTKTGILFCDFLSNNTFRDFSFPPYNSGVFRPSVDTGANPSFFRYSKDASKFFWNNKLFDSDTFEVLVDFVEVIPNREAYFSYDEEFILSYLPYQTLPFAEGGSMLVTNVSNTDDQRILSTDDSINGFLFLDSNTIMVDNKYYNFNDGREVSDSLVNARIAVGGKKIMKIYSGFPSIITSFEKIFEEKISSSNYITYFGQYNLFLLSTDSKKILLSVDSGANLYDIESDRLIDSMRIDSLERYMHILLRFYLSSEDNIIGICYLGGGIDSTDLYIKERYSNSPTVKKRVGDMFRPGFGGIIFNSSGEVLDMYSFEKILDLKLSDVRDIQYYKKYGKVLCLTGSNKVLFFDLKEDKVIELVDNGSVRSLGWNTCYNTILTTSDRYSFKLWDAETGEELYTFFTFDDTEYLVVDKYGRYDGTPNALKQVYYVCGNEIIELEQFKELGWEPDLVAKIMGENQEPIKAKGIKELDICGRTPTIRKEENEEYKYEITPGKGGVGDVLVFVNNKLVRTYGADQLTKTASGFSLTLSPTELSNYFVNGKSNTVTVKAQTANNTLASRGLEYGDKSAEQKATKAPNLYILSVGLSTYKGEMLRLGFASKDAQDFSQVITNAAKALLNTDGQEHVKTYLFTTEKNAVYRPYKDDLEKVFKQIAAEANPEDIIVLFLAGHGTILQSDKQFYFLTADASTLDITGVENKVAISSSELEGWLRNIKAQKQVVILDACNSGQALADIQRLAKREIPISADQRRAYERMKDRTGMYLLAASAPSQAAYETTLYNQGLLTYSLLEGIKTGKGLKGNLVDVSSWFNYAADFVKELAKEIGGGQSPETVGSASFDVGLVTDEVRDGIVLSSSTIFFTSSRFYIDADVQNDDEDLMGLTNTELQSVALRGQDATTLSYVMGKPLPGSYSIRGRYEVKENELAIFYNLVKEGKEIVLKGELKGSRAEKDKLVKQMVEQTLNFLEN